jgi:hypothetical protein
MEGTSRQTVCLFCFEAKPFRQPKPLLPPVVTPTNFAINATTHSNQQLFDAFAFMQEFSVSMIAAQQSWSIVVESHANKCQESEARLNNNMLQLLLVGGNINFLMTGTFQNPQMLTYTQAIKNILAQPTSI